MNLDPDLLKQIIATFKSELEEQSQLITNNLLALEKGVQDKEERIKIIDAIFRSAHNIKGAARGISLNEVGEIAHRIESLFSSIQKQVITISPEIIDLCLEAVDRMQSAMLSFIEKKPLSFDINELLMRLEKGEPAKSDHLQDEVAKFDDGKKKYSANQQKTRQSLEINEHETIRVAVEKIDKVSALTEEIQVSKIAIEDYYTELDQLSAKTRQFSLLWKQIKDHLDDARGENLQRLLHSSNDCIAEMSHVTYRLHKSMRSQLNELSMISNSLQEEVRLLRLVPISNFLCTLPRYVRDLAHQLNKQVEIEILDRNVKMDKLVLEGLKNPITHLIRNAIDHGIEPAEIREKMGKSDKGSIKIDIKDEGNEILINIFDDGAGIDISQITKIAEKRNLSSKSELDRMSDIEILDFIFTPGFSTKEIITDISGRGIGLDVVKANLIDLKGQVSVTTELGKGSTFTLRVPLTLSSEHGLLVKCNDQFFVLPTHSIERVFVLSHREIIEVEGTQAIILNKRTIPLRTLANVLGLEDRDFSKVDRISIVVIKKGWHAVALLVDDVLGEREIVIKPLNLPLSDVPCVSGGTLLERSQVVVVLNSTELINTALNIQVVHRLDFQDTANQIVERPHILVVDDSITTRTLEKNILETQNYKVTVAVNGKEAWDLLQKQHFSLLITDIAMPIMDGFTLTSNVKQSDKLHYLPVIIVTSLGSDAEKARGVEVGADAYIVKNEFESGSLLEIVGQLV